MSLNDHYRKLWKRASKSEREALLLTGFDPDSPTDDGVPYAHRYFGGETESPEGLQEGSMREFAKSSPNGFDINFYQAMAFHRRKREEDVVIVRTYSHDDMLELLTRVLSVLADSNDRAVRLHATCIKLALGMPDQPTMTALAKDNKLTRAAVSARVKTIQRNLNLPPSIYMKSESACQKLSKARRRKL
jgi:hypothetical protein